MKNNEKFNWREYKLLADEHINSENEAMKRTCISRYYYSSFCSSRNFIRQHETYLNKKSKRIINNATGKVHGEIQKTLMHHETYGIEGEKISKKLDKLRKWRNQCDYDDIIVEDLDYLLNRSKKITEYILDFLDKFN